MLMLTTGCTGRDPEQRDYALALFIHEDKSVGVAAAKLSKDGAENLECEVYEGRGSSLERALANADKNTGGSLYFGHLMLCIADERALDKNGLRELTDLFINDEQLARNVPVLAARDAKQLEDTDLIPFARRYYDNKPENTADMNTLIRAIEKDGGALIPEAVCRGKRAVISENGIYVKGW